jgi:hypothetical protein
MYYKKFMFMLYSEIEVGYSVKKKIGVILGDFIGRVLTYYY